MVRNKVLLHCALKRCYIIDVTLRIGNGSLSGSYTDNNSVCYSNSNQASFLVSIMLQMCNSCIIMVRIIASKLIGVSPSADPSVAGAGVFGWSRSRFFPPAPAPYLRYTVYYMLEEKKCQLHEQSQEKNLIFYIIDGKEINLDTGTYSVMF